MSTDDEAELGSPRFDLVAFAIEHTSAMVAAHEITDAEERRSFLEGVQAAIHSSTTPQERCDAYTYLSWFLLYELAAARQQTAAEVLQALGLEAASRICQPPDQKPAAS